MKLKNRILISNTLTISLCLIMLLLVFHVVTEMFRKNYISQIIEEAPVQEQYLKNEQNKELSIEPKERPKDISFIVKQKEIDNFYLTSSIYLAIAVVVIIFVSQIFTRKIFKRIIKPVEQLMNASERIKRGNYDELVNYKGEYEFEQLCESFNNMQLTLKEQKERNFKWQKTKQDMISGISHDLKTPLTSIKGYIKGIKDGVANSTEKQEKYFLLSHKRNCKNLQFLLSDFHC